MKTKRLLSILLASIMLVLALSSCTPSYKVTFKNYDGTVLETVKVKEGEVPVSTVSPTRATGEIYSYIFDGWDKEIIAASADAEYTATYKEVPGTVKWFEGKEIVFLGDSVTFCYAVDEKETYVRTIYETNIIIEENIITIKFVGNGFLRYMVRNMVGLLIEIGSNKKEVSEVLRLFEVKDRKEAGVMAPPNGLYLNNVYYK